MSLKMWVKLRDECEVDTVNVTSIKPQSFPNPQAHRHHCVHAHDANSTYHRCLLFKARSNFVSVLLQRYAEVGISQPSAPNLMTR